MHSALYLRRFAANLIPFRKSCRFLATGAYPESYVTNHVTKCISHPSLTPHFKGSYSRLTSLLPTKPGPILTSWRVSYEAARLQTRQTSGERILRKSACAVTALLPLQVCAEFTPP